MNKRYCFKIAEGKAVLHSSGFGQTHTQSRTHKTVIQQLISDSEAYD